MECVWDAALLKRGDELPTELLHTIQHGSDEQYLEALTQAALDPRYVYTLLSHCEDIFAHVCASVRRHASLATSVATLGRIIPHAPFLAPCAVHLLETENFTYGTSRDDGEDTIYLLGLFRLLRFDYRLFQKYVRPNELIFMLGRSSRPATYLMIRIIQIYLHAADNWFEATVRRYLGEDTPDGGIDGIWDEKTIDYRFLSLWEDERVVKVQSMIVAAAVDRDTVSSRPHRKIAADCFHQSTALIGNVLLPRQSTDQPVVLGGRDQLVHTTTTTQNLRLLIQALKSDQPTLLTGLAGSGKSLLVRHAAQATGRLDKLVTLHLNEQSDAKLLLGIYTTGDTPGSFSWKPGVLTTAVQEGRWVLIEDLDRAPNEVLGTLLPLVERRELMIPNRKETMYAAEGFRIFATVRSSVSHRGEETKPLTHMLGIRHWRSVAIKVPSIDEHSSIAKDLFPGLEQLMPELTAVFKRLTLAQHENVLSKHSKTGVARTLSPRDLLKWCHRVSSLLQSRATFTSSEIDCIYLEAVDCFVGALPEDEARSYMSAMIAEELRIDPQRRDFLLSSREVQYVVDRTKIVIGRFALPRSRHVKVPDTSFSTNPHTTRMLERVTAAVLNQEPLLLVGETGVGKTTSVQHLATHLGKKLVPFNLSQQSEVGDLLGGFKPVNARTLMIPMKDEFDDLFSDSFSTSKNRQFLDLLAKQMAKGNWKAVCKLWRQALGMVDQQRSKSPTREGEAPTKKRRVEGKKLMNFARWDDFTVRLNGIERQLSSGNDALAFSFVEGNIVKAVRNGDWVLLDEINLASPDTLESIADLLDPHAPSLLLTEAGNIQRIDAHPDFRVFAAMNPATDVGKKDLPPGIRSRFTELFVESPDKDLKSLQSIARAYLRQESASDVTVAVDVSLLYQKIISLANENKLVDGAGQRPHFSLRTLTRTLSFAKNIQHMCSLRRALYEGFQMSFLTSLDAESIKLVQPFIEQQLLGKRMNVKAELQRPLKKPNDGHAYVQGYIASKSVPGSKHWIRQGRCDIQDQAHYIITPFIRENLENLVRAASTRQFPVLIQGPTSSGKTSMIEYLAQRTGHRFTRINNHEHTDLQEYLGTYVSDADGRLNFQEGVLVQALREGHWLVLDELNLAPTDVLEALNRLLDDNRELLVPETQEVIRPHPDFMLFATQNPAGLYGGRKTLSRAFRNRFLELHFDDIPIHELQEILHRRTQLPESRCKRIVAAYQELSVLRQENRLFEERSFATLRDLFRWAMRPNDTIEQLAANGYMLLCERVRKPEERVALKAVIERVMSEKGPRVRIDETTLYARDCREIKQYDAQATQQGVVWTKAMRRLYVLVSRAIENNEPVLLVGETGCGKTTVCQMLADALKKDLHTVNAHQNTETGDLIGSQRPVRNRASIEAALREGLSSLPIEELKQGQTLTTEELLASYDAAVSAMKEQQRAVHLQSPRHGDIRLLRTRLKALFEWVDGSLVQAMRNGDFFLLDEISLADDAVLERINSVLESQRTILLAEKGSLDSAVTAAYGFQFFATMNPGGDYGKRELSPALRNRFTEIWVPSLSDDEDILQIVDAKLTEVARPYAPSMVEFAGWFKAKFDASSSSSVSIRDVLAWVEFVNHFAPQELMASVVHGAALVFIDTLGANPAGLISLLSPNLEEERHACLQELSRLLGIDCVQSYGTSFDAYSDDEAFGIGPFRYPRVPGQPAANIPFSFDPATTRSNAMRILRALQLRKSVMLEGSPGVGKTALVTAIASAVGMPLTRINLSDQTDLLDLFGSDSPVEGAQAGTFVWRDAPFLRAMKKGEWVLLDEMNLASQSVLEGLNACLDHRGEIFVPELGQRFSRHPNFRLFAAQNPHHQGGGRKGLPSSFVNRFTVVYADSFRSDDLKLICERMFPKLSSDNIEQAVSFVSRLNHDVVDRRLFGSHGSPWEFNLRDVMRWLTLACSDEGLSRAGTSHDFVDTLFTQRFRSSSDRSCVEGLFASIFPSPIPRSDLFCSSSSQAIQIGLGLLPRDPLTATSQRLRSHRPSSRVHGRILQSVMLCVQEAWPVVLVGSSGAGKTALIENLAASTGADVVTLAMSAETDALDLIGGYEQADPHRKSSELLHTLIGHLHDLSKHSLAEGSTSRAIGMLQSLQDLHADCTNSAIRAAISDLLPQQIRSTLLPLLESSHAPGSVVDKARFEWIDGPLIDALQQGKWIVLDNANLCSPAVLDRLNSLLESNGTLIVNERSAADGSPRTIQPHNNFRIFLTVDPRHGELSRAMRNRAVELYLTLDGEDRDPFANVLQTESAMARFRNVRTASLNSASQLAAVDHLATSDRVLLPRLQRQLSSGLFFDRCRTTDGSGVLPTAHLAAHGSIAVQVEELYRATSSYAQLPADFACVQTFHPLNNQPFVHLSQPSSAQALSLATHFDLAAACNSTKRTLEHVKSNRKTFEKLARFWKTARQEMYFSRGTGSLLDVLEGILRPLSAWLEQPLTLLASDLPTVKTTAHSLISLCTVLLHTLAASDIDLGVLVVCHIVAAKVCFRALSASPPVLSPVFAQCQQGVSELALKARGDTGHGYLALWDAFRPFTPANQDQLEAIIKLEAVIDRFDQNVSSLTLPVDQVVELRMGFQRSLSLGMAAAPDLHALTERATAAMPPAELSVDEQSKAFGKPYFSSSFELLCQRLALMVLGGVFLEPSECARLEFLAGRKTINGLCVTLANSQDSAQSTLRLLGLGLARKDDSEQQNTGGDHVTDDHFSHNFLLNLVHVKQVSLAGLSLLEAESSALGHIVASKAHLLQANSLSSLDKALRRLTTTVLQALSHEGGVSGPAEWCARLHNILSGSAASLEELDLQVVDHQYRSPAIRLGSTVRYLSSRSINVAQSTSDASAAWTCFALACIELFVPSRAFDPVREVQLQRAVYEDTKDDLQSRLQALNSFRATWVGEGESLRARLLQEDINALGRGPRVVEIYRPLTSQLSELQNDFQALLRITQPLRQHDSSVHLLDSSTWSNLAALRRRLEQQYRSYADLAVPMIGFIDCLYTAQHLAVQAVKEDCTRENGLSLANLTPFVKVGIVEWLSDDHFARIRHRCQSRQEQLYWLRALAIRTRNLPPARMSKHLRSAVDDTFRSFYVAWKTELSRDQRQAEAKSSLYRYQGGDGPEDEAAQEELEQLFPTYDDDKSTQRPQLHAAQGAQTLAPLMAKLYHSIYLPSGFRPDGFADLLSDWAEIVPKLSATAPAPDNPTALLVALDKLSGNLAPDKQPTLTANFYTDPDISQSRALVNLVNHVKARFETIHKAWPEHATPIEVTRTCSQILGLGHSEPLARYLPSVEKLHSVINEWQKVASSEFSAAALLEQIMQLIINWRQFELSTWAGMFDAEDEICKRNATSWWYIAYESIIGAAEELSQGAEVSTALPLQLVQTLGSYLESAGLGEYRIRLNMLRDFEADLALATSQTHACIRGALASALSFYSRFETVIIEQLSKKRTELEKDIRNVIQLASWKDRNIETLKQSARSSHKKLFRAVRKYRQILSEPVGSIIHGEFPTFKGEHSEQVAAANLGAFQGHEARYEPVRSSIRLGSEDVSTAVAEIESRSQSLRSGFTASQKIAKFLQDFAEESSELRKATPDTATEFNKTIIQHLKTRKRRLLADVLRDLRLMGFQSNLSEDVLSQQSSLHAVLAKSPPLTLNEHLDGFDSADWEFERLLHIMASAREAAVKHNEDLTPAEITRSRTLLESILQTSIDQRILLCSQLATFKLLRSFSEQFVALCNVEHPTYRREAWPASKLQAAAVALRDALITSIQCIESQGRLSGTDYSRILEQLQSETQELTAVSSAVESHGPLPPHIVDKHVIDLENRFLSATTRIPLYKKQVTITCPELEPVLSQLTRWTQTDHLRSDSTAPATESQDSRGTTARTWSSKLRDVLALVKASTSNTEAVTSNEQVRKAWLTRQQSSMDAAVQDLQLHLIAQELRSLLETLHYVSADTKEGLQHVVAVCQDSRPVLQAYMTASMSLLQQMCDFHAATSKLAYRLAMSFIQIARQGFCQPPEKAQSQDEAGQVESGTGLGEGEGGEDISKDVGDDEDLSELAQDSRSKEKDGETEAEKDAVDMADEDLEGNFDEDAGSDDGEEGDKSQGERSDAELDEEAGQLNEETDDVVDEKTWNDGKQEQAEKEADSGKGTKSEDVSAGNEDAKSGAEDAEGEIDQDDHEDLEGEQEEGVEERRDETEKADPHLPQEDNLDLPENIDLNGEKAAAEELSDADSDMADELDDVDEAEIDAEPQRDRDINDGEVGEEDVKQEDTGEATAMDQDEQVNNDEDDKHSDVAMLDDQQANEQPADGLVSADDGHGQPEQSATQQANGALAEAEQAETENDADQFTEQPGTAEGSNKIQQSSASGQAQQDEQQHSDHPYKQLGDILKQWYDQQRHIEAAPEPNDAEPAFDDALDKSDARFEHTDDQQAETQALGAAKAEQSRALDDQNAVPIDQSEDDRAEEQDRPLEDKHLEDQTAEKAGDNRAATEGVDSDARRERAMVGHPADVEMQHEDALQDQTLDDMEDVDEQLINTHLSQETPALPSWEEARQSWSEHEARTRNMAVVLTEHLRLILQPTQATKMRGDFRTGKRLNIKKIIPYIASSYKRDKIWMRRSIPSKRSYQIMLAIDDSESMNESERKSLAFDTLALIAKSMSMLEVGELCIVGFGETININHDFSMPFTSDAGAEVFRQFSFSQTKTDVRKLLAKSIDLFREARLKATGSASNLWQLQLIISDGQCDDHPSIRQLVRQAHEEQIMVVFIIVDATASTTAAAGPKQSIVDLPRVEFTKDANGEPHMKMSKYLDTFPFKYYLIVRDVHELPSVLAGALRQWFAEVVESGG